MRSPLLRPSPPSLDSTKANDRQTTIAGTRSSGFCRVRHFRSFRRRVGQDRNPPLVQVVTNPDSPNHLLASPLLGVASDLTSQTPRMFSTQTQSTYSYYSFAAGTQQYNEGEDARWSLEDPRFVGSAEEQLWQVDEPVSYQRLQHDGSYQFQQYNSQIEAVDSGFSRPSTEQDPRYEPVYAYNNRSFPPSGSCLDKPNDSSSFALHYSTHYPPDLHAYTTATSLPRLEELTSASYPSFSPYPPPPPSVDSTSALPLPGQSDPRLIHGDQHDLTLSARYQPSFENLPTASIQPPALARHGSLNSLRYGSDSHSSPPRSRPSTGNGSPTSTPTRLCATPRRLNSNLSISVERATCASRSSDHSPTSISPHSYSTSPYRALPSPLSPARKRPHSSHQEIPNYDVSASSIVYSSDQLQPTLPQVQHPAKSAHGQRQTMSETSHVAKFDPRFAESFALEQGVGKLQLAGRPTSSNSYSAIHPATISFPPPLLDTSLPLPPPRFNTGLEDNRRARESEIRDYLRATDKLQAGERTVLILNPRIAQRSYGTERRLLNPPPMAYLLGTSWHSNSTTSFAGRLPSPPSSRRIVLTPDVHVSIYPPRSAEKEALSSKELYPSATWMAMDGKTIVEQDENAPVPISGRFVSKSLAVSLEGDLNKDTVSDVRTVVTVVDKETQQLVGTFLGKPITVISKPSKKKSIVAGGTAGLVHGGLVALFNRPKAGSGSTRYLCTSGPQANFPTTDWKTMTSNAPRPFAPNETSDVRFIPKTQSWDAFIVYTCDLSIPASGEGFIQLPAPQLGYPKPPFNIVPVDTRKPQALFYNQPVVLQCLATGVVSPVLILRRIDSKTTVIGGGSLEPPPPNLNEVSQLSVAPGERIGEPVSQYKNVAFEVYQASPPPRSDNPFDRRLPTSSFLGCMNDEIGIHVAEEEKTILKSEAPLTPPSVELYPSQLRNPLYASTNSYPSGNSGFDSISEGSSDDSDTKRKRARTSTTIGFATTVAMPPSPASNIRPASRHKRRGQSLSSLAALQKSRSPSPRQGVDIVWTVPCGESGVWSILAIDLARHTFFVPPSVDSMPIASFQSGSSPQESIPVPSTPIGPFPPSATRCEQSRRDSALEDDTSYAVLHGDNFDSSYTIWVGDQPCSEQTVQTTQQIIFRPARAPPPPASSSSYVQPVPPRRISIVRFDGVVFPTNVYYRD